MNKSKAQLRKFLQVVFLLMVLFSIILANTRSPANFQLNRVDIGQDTTDLLFRKTIPTEVEKAAVEALEHFPALQSKAIVFEYDMEFGNAFMQAQPRFRSIFYDREERVYRIIMTRHMQVDDKKIPVEDLPHKVLVGWLGHELGHIMDYTTRSGLEMVWFGFRYITSDKFKAKAEREADLYAIKHGMAEEIISTKNFILSNTALPDTYIQKIKRLYLSPQNVLEIVEELDEELEEEDEREAYLPADSSLTYMTHFVNNH